jgi:hypothetical protein
MLEWLVCHFIDVLGRAQLLSDVWIPWKATTVHERRSTGTLPKGRREAEILA